MAKLQILLILLHPILIVSCPGSAAPFMHAKCETEVKFSNSCDDVKKEILGRATSTTWVDPHNGGTYNLTTISDSFIAGQRLTGDKKYTDKFDFTFSTLGASCVVQACSESQVNSLVDYSTNYCNLHDLYCSSVDGCPTVGKDLQYEETFSSCNEHDSKTCVGAKTVRSGGNTQCRNDVLKAADDLARAGLEIAAAVTDCAEGYTPACEDDISKCLQDLSDCAIDLTNAVYACSGDTPTQCSEDIDEVIEDVTAATVDIMDAVLDCSEGNDKDCAGDIGLAAEELAAAGIEISKAVTDCS